MPESILRAGVAKNDITIDDTDAATAIRDWLYAKALVLDDGATRLAIVTMDTTAIGGRQISDGILPDVDETFMSRLRERIESELGIAGANVMVNASHTHPPGRMLCDDDQQIERTFDAVRCATENMTAVTVGAGAGRDERISVNRTLRLKDGRHWTIRHANPCPPDDAVESLGPIDARIGILRVDRLDGTALAVVYHFACHLLFADAHGSITGNFPATASRLIEESLGNDAMAFFLQGAGGDVIDVGFKDFQRPRDSGTIGTMLGVSTLEALRHVRTSVGRLAVVSKTVALPRRTDFAQRIDALQQEQQQLLESLRSTSLNFKSFLPMYLQHALGGEHPSDYAYRYRREKEAGNDERDAMDAWNRGLIGKYLRNIQAMERLTVVQEDIGTLKKHQTHNAAAKESTVDAEVQAIRIGDFVLLTAPIEILTEVSLNIQRASPHEHTFVTGFTNGYLHYGPPADYYDKGGYEATECLLAPQWQEMFESAAARVLAKV